jgi:hypothetical protein
VAVSEVLRILHFQPHRLDFDGQLREQFIPILRNQGGLLDLIAGRHGPDERGPRIVASVWAADAVVALPPWSDRAALDAGGPRAATEERRPEVMPVRVSFRGQDTDVARVLRIFRGRVRPNELDRYIDEAEAGTHADVAAGRGPLALYLATMDSTPDAFVTVSAWSDWSVIEAATGGDIRRPVATQHPERLVESEAIHYEVIERQGHHPA